MHKHTYTHAYSDTHYTDMHHPHTFSCIYHTHAHHFRYIYHIHKDLYTIYMGIQILHMQIYVQYTHRFTLTHRHLYTTLLHTHHTHRDKHSHRNTHTCVPPTHTHHSHRKTLPVCVPVCMYSLRPSSSQPLISI